MRYIILDELKRKDIDKLHLYLSYNLIFSGIEGVYWRYLPVNILSLLQIQHKKCGPYKVALVLEKFSLRMELLIRAQYSLSCKCIAYATPVQQIFLINYLESLIMELSIFT